MNEAERAVINGAIASLKSLLVDPVAPVAPVIPITPVVQPAPAPIGHGDVLWKLSTTTLFPPHPGIYAVGDHGASVQFVADAKNFPNGIVATFNDQSPLGIAKDYCISDRPHDFRPLGANPYALQQGVGNAGAIYLRFGLPKTGKLERYDVLLAPGGTYYINFRQYHEPRLDAVVSQFVAVAR